MTQDSKFVEWFHSLEGFRLKSERFYETLAQQNPMQNPKLIVDWLQAAFEAGRQVAQDSEPQPKQE